MVDAGVSAILNAFLPGPKAGESRNSRQTAWVDTPYASASVYGGKKVAAKKPVVKRLDLAQLSLFAVPERATSLIFKDFDLKGLHYGV